MTCSCGCATACGELPTRFPITNPSGLSQLAYRVGTFATFRRALLQSLDGETELAAWKPTASRDLGLQLIDWWAYIADILTFYNERIANEDYLGTARLDTSVAHLVSLLGYRPRPGIGAVGTLAVIASAPGPLIVPSGLAVASKATPAVESQTFETTQATTFTEPTSVPGPAPDDLSTPPPLDGPPATEPGAAQVAPHQQLIARGGVLVKGTPSSISVGDRLLLIPTNWTSSDDPHSAAVVQVTGLAPEPDPHGRKNTRVLLDGAGRLPGGADASTYRLAYATRAAHLSTLPPKAAVITFVTDPTTNAAADTIVLDGPARYLKTGDPLLVQTPGAGTGPSPGAGFDLVQLTGYAEALWYANAPDPTQPATFPANGNPPGVPIIVSRLTVDPVAGNDLTHCHRLRRLAGRRHPAQHTRADPYRPARHTDAGRQARRGRRRPNSGAARRRERRRRCGHRRRGCRFDRGRDQRNGHDPDGATAHPVGLDHHHPRSHRPQRAAG
jgi:hypothetical protein